MGLKTLGQRARDAFKIISATDSETRNSIVLKISSMLEKSLEAVLTANQMDIEAARIAGLPEALIDRLTLTEPRLKAIIDELVELAKLPDPVGSEFDQRTLPNGLRISRRRVPLGVLGVIYESRPNVTIDVAALAVKTGNTVILRGGKETIQSNLALVRVIRDALRAEGLPDDVIQFIDNPDRALVGEMLRLSEFIDVIIPRGGSQLHDYCRKNATIPVFTGGIGICHLYIDDEVDFDESLPVILNAKTQRPSVCNSLDTLLVHEAVAAEFLPRVVDLLAQHGVTFRADPIALALLDHPKVLPAGTEDFDTEWLSLVLGLKVVPDLETALLHISEHGTHHSDGILTGNKQAADRFVNEVDSAAVYVNASTRFTDGGQFGLGAEVAVSTQRLHARGPMGLPELTSYKWVVIGEYTIRD